MAFREINLERDRPGYFAMAEVYLFDEDGNCLAEEILLYEAVVYAFSARPIYILSRHRAASAYGNRKHTRKNAIAIFQNGLWDDSNWDKNYQPQ